MVNSSFKVFKFVIAVFKSSFETYTNKVSEIEEAEKKAAEEAEKKKKETAAANNNSNSNSSDNSSSNSSSSSTSSKGGSQSSWSITAVCWVESEGQNVTFNAPQVIYDAWNNGKGYDWAQSVTEDGVCYWSVEGGTIGYACDQYGNVLYTFN